MALRSPALWLGNPAVQHTAQNDRLFRAGLLRAETGQTAANRPLTALSGVIAGAAGTMGEVVVLSNTQFTVNPARWVIQASASALGGVYGVTNDAVTTLGVTAQDAAQSRRSYFGVWTGDSFTAGSGDDLPHWGLVDGPLAASNPALPGSGLLPANFLALGEFLIPPTGQAVTYTPYNLATGLRGGILPVTATDTRAGASEGVYRDFPSGGTQAGGPQRWSVAAAAWQPVSFVDFPVAQIRQAVASAGTAYAANNFSTVLFDTADVDSHHGFVANRTSGTQDSRWTCPAGQGGLYEVEGVVAISLVPTNGNSSSRLLKNGAVIPGSMSIGNTAVANSIIAATGRRFVTLAPGDYLEAQGLVNAAWGTRVDASGASSSITVVRVR